MNTACAIEKTVSRLDGIVDLIGARIVIDLPQAKADNWHLVATVQFDIGGSHDGVRSCSSWQNSNWE